MPKVARFVDDLRAAFGVEYVNGAVRAGLRGQPVFWASEDGHEVGTRTRWSDELAATVTNPGARQ